MKVRFGDVTFDPGRRAVFRGPRTVPLSPKAFRFLELLLTRRPTAVSMRTNAHIRPDDLAAPLDVLAGIERMAREGKAGNKELNRGPNGDENPAETGKPENGFSSAAKS